MSDTQQATRPLPSVPKHPHALKSAASFGGGNKPPGRSRANTTLNQEEIECLDTSDSRPGSRARTSSAASQASVSASRILDDDNAATAVLSRAKAEPLIVHRAVLQSRPKESKPKADKPSASTPFWSRSPAHGRLPSHGFRAHATSLVGADLYLFGGCNQSQCFRDMWKLDLDCFMWSKPKLSGNIVPPLCRAHTATTVGKNIFIIGGGEGGQYYNDVYIFDTERMEWLKPKVYGAIPSARRAHSAVLWKDQIVLFGGGNGARALQDTHILNVSNLDRLEWSEMQTKGKRPIERGYHTLNLVGNTAILYGGSDGKSSFSDLWALDLESKCWTELKMVNPEEDDARLSHTSTLIGQNLWIIGGHNGISYSNEILLLNLVTLKFERRKANGTPPCPRGYHTANYYNGRIVLIAGYDGKQVFDEVFDLSLGVLAYTTHIKHFEVGSGVVKE